MPFGSKHRDGTSKSEPGDGDAAPMEYHFRFDGPAIEDIRLRTLDIRVNSILTEFVEKVGAFPFSLTAGYTPVDVEDRAAAPGPDQETRKAKPESFTPVDPLYSLDQVILPQATFSRLLDVAFFIESTRLIFDEWNLRSIEPKPSLAINFRGPPGTGKTMAAHALARHLQRKILLCRLSDLESKFHGDGPKNLVELFRSVRQSGAILFMDEAESLLSKRFAQPEQAAESAINSMRTELLMALDSSEGVTIFASNLPHSYDPAIESRLWNVDFELPDEQARSLIWKAHLPSELPTSNLSLDRLAAVDGVTGRDIKQAVISAALSAARQGLTAVPQYLLEEKITAQAKPSLSTIQSAAARADEIAG